MPRITRSSKKAELSNDEGEKCLENRKRKSLSENENLSPNKSSKKIVNLEISPEISDCLAEKLSLEAPKISKFSSARRALASNENFRLPGREKQFEELSQIINRTISTKTSSSLYINGPPGTGKTATLLKIINNEEYESKLKVVFINSTSISSIGAIYKKICSELDLKDFGNEKDSLLLLENYFKNNNKKKTTLLVLDEIDQLCSGKNQNVLYHIFEWPSISNSKLLLIGIANSLDLTDRLLIRLQRKCELKPLVMHFPAYTKNEIVEIFKSRLEESDLFPPSAIQLLAAKVSAVSGDIRRALNLGKKVIEIAELEKKKNDKTLNMTQINAIVDAGDDESKIQLKEVVSVLNNVYGCAQNLNDEVDDIPLQQKILLCTLLLIMKHDKNKDITIGRLHDIYKKVCKNRNIYATDLSEFVNLCLLVETRGILRLTKKKEPRFHRIYMQWNEDEVSLALKDKQMITNILNEQSILSR
ncbi:cell division control protein 6 homolog isoform X1 [Chironomus tepperi]|uniref:cell division control protein 6 homolog isoform X1 n=1 Tax=Chironomus tepperi TaxID=113505 RepID=UPI00391EEA82